MGRRITEAMKDDIVDMYIGGITIQGIAADLEISGASIYVILRERGITTKSKGFSGAEEVEIIEEIQKGKKPATVALERDISVNTIYTLLRRSGVQMEMAEERKKSWEYRLDMAIDMYVKGAKIVDIYQVTAISQGTLYMELRKRGLKPDRHQEFDVDAYMAYVHPKPNLKMDGGEDA